MKIVGVAACTVGIAHTYIAREKLMEAAKKRGHEIHMETQGVIGIEDEVPTETVVMSPNKLIEKIEQLV